jgi:DNA-binding beta-propeller fold protein YncE
MHPQSAQNLLIAFAGSFLLFIGGCKPDPVPDPDPSGCEGSPSAVPAAFGGKGSTTVWIANEGNFQWGNASVDLYNPETGVLTADVFATVNQRGLGDVFQSMAFAYGEAYLVINNSGRVEVTDPETLLSKGVISGLVSPRFFLPIHPQKAYVSDLYAQSIAIVNPESRQQTGSIPFAGWSEEMVVVEGKVWVTNPQRDYVYLIDPASDAVTDSLEVGPACGSIVTDAAGRVWIGCGVNLADNQPGRLHRIQANTKTIEKTFPFESGEGVSAIGLSADRNILYFLGAGVFALRTDANALPDCPLVEEDGGLFYGLGIDPANGDIYVADAVDYVQRGAILRYRANGEKVAEFRAGIIPGRFYFR